MSFKVISGNYHARQLEFHPVEEKVLFGTVRGNVCLTSLLDNSIQYLGNYGRGSHDAILGLCWLKSNPHRFLSGSSMGKLICGDCRVDADSLLAGQDSVVHYQEYPVVNELTSVHTNCLSDWLLVSGYDKKVRIFDVETAVPLLDLQDVHTKAVNISRFTNHSPFTFATSSFDGSVKSWDMRMHSKRPIYEIESESGYVVMINFSHDDNYILVSGHDNEITQYLSLDGRKHTTFDVPNTGMQEHNYTRAYYSSSGSYILTGACEDSAASLLCSVTGRLLSRFEVYPDRKHSSLYIQSLRGSPLNDGRLAVLCGYKDYRCREIVLVDLPLPRLESTGCGGVHEQSSPSIAIEQSSPSVAIEPSFTDSLAVSAAKGGVFEFLASPASNSLHPSSDLHQCLGSLRCLGRSVAASLVESASVSGERRVCEVDAVEAERCPGLDLAVYFGTGTGSLSAAPVLSFAVVHSAIILARHEKISLAYKAQGLVNLAQTSAGKVLLPVLDLSEEIADSGGKQWWPFVLDFLYIDNSTHQRRNTSPAWSQRELHEHREQQRPETDCSSKPSSDSLDGPETYSVKEREDGALTFSGKYFSVNLFTARLVCLRSLHSESATGRGTCSIREDQTTDTVIENENLWRSGPLVHHLISSISQVRGVSFACRF